MKLDIPKKPRIRLKDQVPDQRTITVAPIRAATDRNLTPMQLRALLVYCSYVNKAGVAWVGLERIGSDLGVSSVRACQLVKALTDKGYIKTLHKGYNKICANTRQVIYKEGISADDAAAISGELAPYQIRQQEKERDEMEKKQAKRKPRRPKPIEPGYQLTKPDSVSLSDSMGSDEGLAEKQIHTQARFSHIDADILELAIASLGDAPLTDANIEAAIERLMR